MGEQTGRRNVRPWIECESERGLRDNRDPFVSTYLVAYLAYCSDELQASKWSLQRSAFRVDRSARYLGFEVHVYCRQRPYQRLTRSSKASPPRPCILSANEIAAQLGSCTLVDANPAIFVLGVLLYSLPLVVLEANLEDDPLITRCACVRRACVRASQRERECVCV